MHDISARDGGRVIDWGLASADYARFRPTYPPSLFQRLEALGVGRSGSRVLDLGTGVGFLASQFARQGCEVTGIDIAAGQIAMAKRLAEEEKLEIDYRHVRVEEAAFPSARFDVVTAGQCWLYFDAEVVAKRVREWLAPNGRLVTCHFSWLARLDPIARATEELVLKYNPDWSAANWAGRVAPDLKSMPKPFRVVSFFVYDEPIPFTRETWRGRIRASRGVGATLSEDEVRAFDEEHDELLSRIAGDEFVVWHRIDAHVFAPVPDLAEERIPV